MVVYGMARRGGRTEVVTLLLTGLALTAITGALVGLLAVAADDDQLRDIVFWSLGSLGGATWDTVLAGLPFIALGVVAIPLFARSLNLMALGEREARHLGVDTERVKLALVVLCALSVGAGVALAGIIGFVGLIVPHLRPPRGRPRPPGRPAGQRAGRRGAAARRRRRRADGRRAGRDPHRRGHRPPRRPVLPLAGAPHPARARGLGVSAMLEAEGVVFRAGGRALVDGVDLRVMPGELVVLVGPNGAGKSTLVGLLGGDLRPAAGTVRLFGRLLDDYRLRELARLRAVLPQHTAMEFAFSVEEVVAMGRAAAPASATASEERRRVRACMAQAEVLDLAGRLVTTLSGGERARVTLARVLAQDAPLLLLDEPTAALDLRHQELVMDLAGALAHSGRAVVAVLHDLNLAAAHADRVAVMRDGRLEVCAEPLDRAAGGPDRPGLRPSRAGGPPARRRPAPRARGAGYAFLAGAFFGALTTRVFVTQGLRS